MMFVVWTIHWIYISVLYYGYLAGETSLPGKTTLLL